ncbi:hypothetical protein [Actinacidiphila sp. bgisy167]|uniref:hypothetical protein n=1 Tax=Actinacidiphila sp. bgisy167 TaxID=3413797 RepID=UPI003D762D1D
MPRPSDWNVLGLHGDPTPGDPVQIRQLVDDLVKIGSQAKAIAQAIDKVMDTADSSVFAGKTADALRGKVDDRLRNHINDVANSFWEVSQNLGGWANHIEEAQRKADGALSAGRGLAKDDPQLEALRQTAESAGAELDAVGSTIANAIHSASDIRLPISDCQVFWEMFQILAIILIVPALIFGGPVALLALGVNMTLFIKAAIDFAHGDIGFLDLFLAGLGIIAPTTKALPIFAIGGLLKNGFKAVLQFGRNSLISLKDIASGFRFATVLTGLRDVARMSMTWVRQGGLWVMQNFHTVPALGGTVFVKGGLVVVQGIRSIPVVVRGWGSAIRAGTPVAWRNFQVFTRETWSSQMGGAKWTRLLLPVTHTDIAEFGLKGALRMGFWDRGVLGRGVWDIPVGGTVAHTVSAVPMGPHGATSHLDLGHANINMARMDLENVRFGNFSDTRTSIRPSSFSVEPVSTVDLAGLRVGTVNPVAVHGASSVMDNSMAGFRAVRHMDDVVDIAGTQMNRMKIDAFDAAPGQMGGGLGVSAAAPDGLATHSSGLYVPGSASAPAVHEGVDVSALVAKGYGGNLLAQGPAGLLTAPPGGTGALHTALTGVPAPTPGSTAIHDVLTAPGTPGAGAAHTTLTGVQAPPNGAAVHDLLASPGGTAGTHGPLSGVPGHQSGAGAGGSAFDLLTGGSKVAPNNPVPTHIGSSLSDNTAGAARANQAHLALDDIVGPAGSGRPGSVVTDAVHGSPNPGAPGTGLPKGGVHGTPPRNPARSALDLLDDGRGARPVDQPAFAGAPGSGKAVDADAGHAFAGAPAKSTDDLVVTPGTHDKVAVTGEGNVAVPLRQEPVPTPTAASGGGHVLSREADLLHEVNLKLGKMGAGAVTVETVTAARQALEDLRGAAFTKVDVRAQADQLAVHLAGEGRVKLPGGVRDTHIADDAPLTAGPGGHHAPPVPPRPESGLLDGLDDLVLDDAGLPARAHLGADDLDVPVPSHVGADALDAPLPSRFDMDDDSIPGSPVGAHGTEDLDGFAQFVDLFRPLRRHVEQAIDNPVADIEVALVANPGGRTWREFADGEVGHAMVSVMLPGERKALTIGFYPGDEGKLFGRPGALVNDSDYLLSGHVRVLSTYRITAEQLFDGYRYAMANSGAVYDLFRYNCVRFAEGFVSAALGKSVADLWVAAPYRLADAMLSPHGAWHWADGTGPVAKLTADDTIRYEDAFSELSDWRRVAPGEAADATDQARHFVYFDHQRPLIDGVLPTVPQKERLGLLGQFETMVTHTILTSGEDAGRLLSRQLGEAYGTLRPGLTDLPAPSVPASVVDDTLLGTGKGPLGGVPDPVHRPGESAVGHSFTDVPESPLSGKGRLGRVPEPLQLHWSAVGDSFTDVPGSSVFGRSPLGGVPHQGRTPGWSAGRTPGWSAVGHSFPDVPLSPARLEMEQLLNSIDDMLFEMGVFRALDDVPSFPPTPAHPGVGGADVHMAGAGGPEVHVARADKADVHVTGTGGPEVRVTGADGSDVHVSGTAEESPVPKVDKGKGKAPVDTSVSTGAGRDLDGVRGGFGDDLAEIDAAAAISDARREVLEARRLRDDLQTRYANGVGTSAEVDGVRYLESWEQVRQADAALARAEAHWTELTGGAPLPEVQAFDGHGLGGGAPRLPQGLRSLLHLGGRADDLPPAPQGIVQSVDHVPSATHVVTPLEGGGLSHALVPSGQDLTVAHWLSEPQSAHGWPKGNGKEAYEGDLKAYQDVLSKGLAGAGDDDALKTVLVQQQKSFQENVDLFRALEGRTELRNLRMPQLAAIVMAERRALRTLSADTDLLAGKLRSGDWKWAEAYPIEGAQAHELIAKVHKHLQEDLSLTVNLKIGDTLPGGGTLLDAMTGNQQLLRNAWETNTAGAGYFVTRGNVEETLGLPASVKRTTEASGIYPGPAGARFAPTAGDLVDLPNYAALTSKYRPSGVKMYGQAVFHLKSDVMQRATFTPADSFSDGLQGARSVTGSGNMLPLLNHGHEPLVRLAFAEATDFQYDSAFRGFRDAGTLERRLARYFEAQIHGGVKWDDLDRVVLVNDGFNPAALQAQKLQLEQFAQARGLSFTVEVHDARLGVAPAPGVHPAPPSAGGSGGAHSGGAGDIAPSSGRGPVPSSGHPGGGPDAPPAAGGTSGAVVDGIHESYGDLHFTASLLDEHGVPRDDLFGGTAARVEQSGDASFVSPSAPSGRSVSSVPVAKLTGDGILDVIVGKGGGRSGDLRRTLGGFEFGAKPRNNGGNNLISRPIVVTVKDGGTEAKVAVHLNVVLTSSHETRVGGHSSITIKGSDFHLTARSKASQDLIDRYGPSSLTADNSIHVGPSNADSGWKTRPDQFGNLARELGVSEQKLIEALERRFPPGELVDTVYRFQDDVKRAVVHGSGAEDVRVRFEGDRSFPVRGEGGGVSARAVPPVHGVGGVLDDVLAGAGAGRVDLRLVPGWDAARGAAVPRSVQQSWVDPVSMPRGGGAHAPRYEVRSGFDVRTFSVGDRSVTDLTVRVRLEGGGLSPAELDGLWERALGGVERVFNRPGEVLPDGSVLHVTLERVSGGASDAHLSVRVGGSDGVMNQHQWRVDATEQDLAHELGHQLGLRDEYRDTTAGHRPEVDGSLMGNYHNAAPDGLSQGGLRSRYLELIHAQVRNHDHVPTPHVTSAADDAVSPSSPTGNQTRADADALTETDAAEAVQEAVRNLAQANQRLHELEALDLLGTGSSSRTALDAAREQVRAAEIRLREASAAEVRLNAAEDVLTAHVPPVPPVSQLDDAGSTTGTFHSALDSDAVSEVGTFHSALDTDSVSEAATFHSVGEYFSEVTEPGLRQVDGAGGTFTRYDEHGNLVATGRPLPELPGVPDGLHLVTPPQGAAWLEDASGTRIVHVGDQEVTATDHGLRMTYVGTGGPRDGEFMELGADGSLVKQGFNVLDRGRSTSYQYVLDHSSGLWQRTGRDGVGTGVFHHGTADLKGAANGRVVLLSATGAPVPVFERRPLPGGGLLDSFRRTDTIDFGRTNPRTHWARWGEDGVLSGTGIREYDTAGTGWRDLDGRGNVVHEYQAGLQKHGNGTGHTLALANADGELRWHRYDGASRELAEGPRTPDRHDSGWTDYLAGDGRTVAQRKWGMGHLPERAGQYEEHTLVQDPGTPGGWKTDGTWQRQSPHGKKVGKAERVDGALLVTERWSEQRPPVWVRKAWLPGARDADNAYAHVLGDNAYQLFTWKKGSIGTGEGSWGVRYVGFDGGTLDLTAKGDFARLTTKLHDGTTLKVGDHAKRPAYAPAAAGHQPWEAGKLTGYRVPKDPARDGMHWQDVFRGADGQIRVAREGLPGGQVLEYRDPPLVGTPTGLGAWVTRDAHGNVTGLRQANPNGLGDSFIEGTGKPGSAKWTWREQDAKGSALGPSGTRKFFRGSNDWKLSWDDSFRDFDAQGNLVRERRMLDNGAYVDAWRDDNGRWLARKFGKDGGPVDPEPQVRSWWNGTAWQDQWSHGAQRFRDEQRPLPGGTGATVRLREVPAGHGGPLRVREYDTAAATPHSVWKEFDHGSVVRERRAEKAADGTVTYLETDAWRGQWNRYDARGRLLAQRTDSGLVWERNPLGQMRLVGNEYDYRGPLSEIRGWGRRVREAQRMPWSGTVLPDGLEALREARYRPYWQVVGGKALVEFGQEFVLEFAANLAVNAIVDAAQNKQFNGADVLKAFANAAVSSGVKTGVGIAVHENRAPGLRELGNLKTTLANVDSGKHPQRRPFNHEKTWSNEWGGNETPTRWRGGIYDFTFCAGTSVLSGWVNGAMNAAVWGVSDANGNTVKLSGADAFLDGGINATAALTTSVSTALVKNLVVMGGGSRLFHRQGFADFWVQLPFKIFEKSIQTLYLTSNFRAGMNPSWYQVPPAGTQQQ